ncbi:uncharacterized protein RJT20DRAFT_93712 [Scheffersomyces xylosifermentans]|uniref:uncharacterized protein n=1 Tax=Scheffersomyces xylosifermentans TaxID=1304137 RepID=UPI00315C5031
MRSTRIFDSDDESSHSPTKTRRLDSTGTAISPSDSESISSVAESLDPSSYGTGTASSSAIALSRAGTIDSGHGNNQTRSRRACERCRRRRTKCSGAHPCEACVASGNECQFPRKPKKMMVLDTDIEQYQSKIELLQQEIEKLRKESLINYDHKSDKLNLSILLGSPSCEMVCWNLNEFTIANKGIFNDITVSPDFSTFREEKTYNQLFNFSNRTTSESEILKQLSYGRIMELNSYAISFISSGYMTVDQENFERKCLKYFENGQLKLGILNFKNKVDYFFLKVLTVMALGEIYSPNFVLGRNCVAEVPGLQYFKIVIKYLPSEFSFFGHRDINDTLEIIELFCLIAIYLRILDKKIAAVSFTLQALQMCISLNLHKDRHLRGHEINEKPQHYINRVWWGTFCLNRFFSSRIGQPVLVSVDTITNNASFEIPNASTPNVFSTSDSCMKCYIELSKIADRITSELYATPFHNKQYLQSILSIMERLLDWNANVPEDLKLTFPLKETGPDQRLSCSLYLNYLHHIYLACIPILLNFGKVQISNFFKLNQLMYNPFNIDDLPRNISRIIHSIINSGHVTIHIFRALYKGGFIRIFGFTDLDYLFSSSLIFLICILLKIDTSNEKYLLFEDQLESSMEMMNEMRKSGNLVARGKLNQFVSLINSLEPMLVALGKHDLISKIKKYEEIKTPTKRSPRGSTSESMTRCGSIASIPGTLFSHVESNTALVPTFEPDLPRTENNAVTMLSTPLEQVISYWDSVNFQEFPLNSQQLFSGYFSPVNNDDLSIFNILSDY